MVSFKALAVDLVSRFQAKIPNKVLFQYFALSQYVY